MGSCDRIGNAKLPKDVGVMVEPLRQLNRATEFGKEATARTQAMPARSRQLRLQDNRNLQHSHDVKVLSECHSLVFERSQKSDSSLQAGSAEKSKLGRTQPPPTHQHQKSFQRSFLSVGRRYWYNPKPKNCAARMSCCYDTCKIRTCAPEGNR